MIGQKVHLTVRFDSWIVAGAVLRRRSQDRYSRQTFAGWPTSQPTSQRDCQAVGSSSRVDMMATRVYNACRTALGKPARAVTSRSSATVVPHKQPVAPPLRICHGFRDTVGSTPLLRLRKASEETGCTVWGKCEFLNPGGSVKDRPAVFMLKKAEEEGRTSSNRLPVTIYFRGFSE